MPDKIKETFEAINDKELFLDEQDFRDNVLKDPKGTFEALNNYGKTKGFFLDYSDFENALELKKKLQSVPSFSTNLGDFTKPLPSASEQTLPLASSLQSKSAKIEPQKIDKTPVARIGLYSNTLQSIRKRNSDNLLLAEQYRQQGDEEGMRTVLGQIDQDQRKIDVLSKGIEAQKQQAQIDEPNTIGNNLLIGGQQALGLLARGVTSLDESLNIIKKDLWASVGVVPSKEAEESYAKFLERSKGSFKQPSDFIAETGKELIKAADTKTQTKNIGLENGGSAWEALKEGNVSQAADYGFKGFIGSLPTSILYLNPLTAATVSGGMVGNQLDESMAEKGSVNSNDLLAGTIKASLELVTERMFGAGKATRELITKFGKEAAEQMVRETSQEMLKKSLISKLGKNTAEEITGEVVNQFGSNIVDKYMLDKKDVGVLDGIGDAAIIALFAGGGQGGVSTTLNHYIDKKKTAQYEESKAKADNLMEQSLNSESEIVATTLENHAEKLNAEAEKIAIEQNKIGEFAEKETVAQINTTNNEIDELQQAKAQLEQIGDTEAVIAIDTQLEEKEKLLEKTIKQAKKEADLNFENENKPIETTENALIEQNSENKVENLPLNEQTENKPNEEKTNTADSGLGNDIVEPIISEKTQERIKELEAQRDSEIANYKALYTDNPSEAEKIKRNETAKQEIADEYNTQIEEIKNKAAERANKIPKTVTTPSSNNASEVSAPNNVEQTPTASDVESNIQPSVNEKGTYTKGSVFNYFAKIFYGQRGGFNDFTKSEIDQLSKETKEYLIRIYHQLKNLENTYEVYDAEKKLKDDLASGKSAYDITKSKTFNGKDLFFDRTIVDTDEKRIQFARMFLSNDPSGRDNGITNGISGKTKVKKFEYPSQEVLKNLDEVFNGDSKNYQDELKAVESLLSKEQINEQPNSKSNIPPSNKGTQTAEPTKQESEGQVEGEQGENNVSNESGKEAKPTKAEKIASAEKSINDIRNKLKERFKVDLPEGTKTAGFTMNELIDVVADTAIQLAKTGIEINEAIKQAIQFLKDEGALEGFDENEVESKAVEAVKTDVDKATEKVEILTDDQKGVVDEITIAENEEERIQGVKGFIDSMNRSEKLTQKEKDEMNERLGRNYDVLSNAQLEVIGKAIIEELGGLDNALLEAQNTKSNLLPYIRIFILGQAIIENRRLEANAVTQEAKNKFADIQIDLFDKLDKLARDYGRAVQALTQLYAKSNLAVVRKVKSIIADRNGAKQIEAEQQAENIGEIIIEDDNTDAANEALQELLNDEREKVKELEAAYEKLKKEIANPTESKPSKKRDFGVSIDRKETIKKLRETKYFASRRNIIPVAPTELIDTMFDLATDYMQEGFSGFEDIQKKLKKDLGGLHSDYYAEAYEKAKENAIEKGAKESEFTPTEQVNIIIDRQLEESDVAKLAKASEKLAKAKGNAPQTVAKRVINDAKTFLNGETTKKEGELINKLIAKVTGIAKDKYKTLTKNKTSAEDLLAFAIENKKEGKELFEAAKKEVNTIIENDTKLSETEINDLKKFLENYQKSIFDALLTNKNKDLIIKEALVKLGYATQDSKGNIVADLGRIALSKNTPKESIEKVKNAISKDLGLEETEIDDLLTALEQRFNDLILAKKEAKVNAVLNADKRYKASLQIQNKARKDRIRSLIELYNAGGLTNDKILEKMARDLGIIAFTDNDQKIIEDLLERIDNAPTGFLAAGLEEELQAYFENTGGTFAMKEFFERLRARLLSGFITAGKNLTGFFDTAAMIGQQILISNSVKEFAKGNVDLNILKVIGQAQRIGGTLALESFVNGSVDNGSAFAEQTGQKEGTPSVRFLEFQKYHNYWSTNIPVLKQGLQAIQFVKKNEKYVQRVLGSTDSVNHTILQEMKSYTFTKKKLIQNGMSAKEAASKAFAMTYALDITEATKEASKIYQEQGLDIAKNQRAFNKLVYKLATNASLLEARNQAIKEFGKNNLDYKSISGQLKLNRRINEIIQQQRENEVIDAATEFASRYTYKQSDGGVMAGVAYVIKGLKNMFPIAAAQIRKNAKGTPRQASANKVANAIEIVGELIFTANMPFINGVANILEKGLEYNPVYGGIKSATYLGLALGSKSDQARAEAMLAKSGEIAYRAILGTLLIALLQSLADDDEADKEKAIYGQGDKNFNKNKVIETVRPQNTIKINGRNVSFDFFGTLATAIKIEAIGKDIKRYADKEVTNSERFGMLYNQIISSSFTKGLSDLQKGTQDIIEKGKTDFFEKKASELLTRVFIPFTSFLRQLGQTAKPEAQKVIGWDEQILKQAGVGGWVINRPNLDYRGRTYETGDLYTSSASGAINLFGAVDKNDPIDVWVLKSTNNNLSITDIKKDTDEKYFVENSDGTLRPMTDLEKYDFSAEQTKLFNKLLIDFYENKKNQPTTPETQAQNTKDLSRLHSVSKDAARQKLLLGSKDTETYIKDMLLQIIEKNSELDKDEAKRKALDIAFNVSEETKLIRERLPSNKYEAKLVLAKKLRPLTEEQQKSKIKEWVQGGVIELDTEYIKEIRKLAVEK
jgi:hypothetical protein